MAPGAETKRRTVAGILLALLIAVAAMAGGLLRLAYDQPEPVNIDADTAAKVATCLGAGDVAAAVPVAVHHLSGAGVPPPDQGSPFLRYVAPEKVPFFTRNAALNAQLSGTGNVEIPAGTRVSLQRGEFILESGTLKIGREGGTHQLTSASPVRFRQAEASTYEIVLDKVVVPAPPAGEARALPIGAAGKLLLPSRPPETNGDTPQIQPINLVPVQPLATNIWVEGANPNIMPTRASGRKGLSDLAVEAQRPGLQFDAAGFTMRGCAWIDAPSTRLAFAPVSVMGTQVTGPGAASVTLAMPAKLLPAFSGDYRPEAVRIVLASADGRYVGYGVLSLFDRGYAALIALFFTAALLWGTLHVRQRYSTGSGDWGEWSAGLFLDADRKASLSLFQIFFWTVITVWGLIYVFVVTGSLLSLTPGMLALLGIAGAGTIAARFTSAGPAAGAQARGASEVDFAALLSTDGTFDLLKLQLFIFTLLIGAYVVWRLVDTGAFPELDGNTLLLLGVSQGLYVGGKVASTTPLARAQAAKLQVVNKTDEIARLQAEEADLKASSDPPAVKKDKEDAIAAAIKTASDDLAKLRAELEAAVKNLGLAT